MKTIFGGLTLPVETKLLLLLRSLTGHIIFGVIVALFAKEKTRSSQAQGPGYSSSRKMAGYMIHRQQKPLTA